MFSTQILIAPVHVKKFRSSRTEVFCKKVILKKIAKFTGKGPKKGAFFDEVATLLLASL